MRDRWRVRNVAEGNGDVLTRAVPASCASSGQSMGYSWWVVRDVAGCKGGVTRGVPACCDTEPKQAQAMAPLLAPHSTTQQHLAATSPSHTR